MPTTAADPSMTEHAYDLSIPHPNIPQLIEVMDAEASAFRAAHPPQFSPVGTLGRAIDIFIPEGQVKGAVAMVHGGYWVRGAPTNISHLAAGALACDVAVGFVPYGLCPEFSIGDAIDHTIDAANIIADTLGYPVAMFGHSAGGHLAASVVSEGVSTDAVLLSGLYDLSPITKIPLNETLGMTEDDALRWSPSRKPPMGPTAVAAFVGSEEPSGFLDQQQILAEKWGAACGLTTEVLAGGDHFSALATLTAPDSALTAALVTAAINAVTRPTLRSTS
ncbi:MAG: alpha/beta hydrolase [Acidobacteria bacterium]|nr:alpha/beta hydrolase [Acidobacteriota bacterium]